MDYYRPSALNSLLDEETPVKTMDEIVANISPPITTRKVRPGDNLSKIAAEYGTTVRELVRLNPQIKNPNLIRPGDGISVPGSGMSMKTDTYAGMQADIDAALSPDRPGMEEGMLESSYPEAMLPMVKPLAGLAANGLTKGIGALARAAPMAPRAGSIGNNVMRGVAQNARPALSNVRPPQNVNPGMVKAMLAKMQPKPPGAPLAQGGQMPPGADVGRFFNRGAMPPGPNQALGQGARMPTLGQGTRMPPQNTSLLDALRQGGQKVNAGANEGIIQSLIQSANNPTINSIHKLGVNQLDETGGYGNIPFQELLRRINYR